MVIKLQRDFQDHFLQESPEHVSVPVLPFVVPFGFSSALASEGRLGTNADGEAESGSRRVRRPQTEPETAIAEEGKSKMKPATEKPAPPETENKL